MSKNKNDICILISQKVKITKKDISTVLNTFIEVVKETLVEGDRLTLEGFITLNTMVIDKKEGCCFSKEWSTPKKYIPIAKYSNIFKKQIATKKI